MFWESTKNPRMTKSTKDSLDCLEDAKLSESDQRGEYEKKGARKGALCATEEIVQFPAIILTRTNRETQSEVKPN